MNFLDGSLFVENQDKLVITAAPYGPEWFPSDYPEDIAVTMDAQVQKAVDCYNAGATVLHLHVRELDGKGSKKLSKFNELIAGVRKAVPDMIIQVGGSISFAPPEDGAAAKWLHDDTRHMLAELDPKPDQVTVTLNTTQMNVVEQMDVRDYASTSMGKETYEAYREMIVPSGPGFIEEHVAHGGVGEMLAAWILRSGRRLDQFETRAANGYLSGRYGSQRFHRQESHLDPESIAQFLTSQPFRGCPA